MLYSEMRLIKHESMDYGSCTQSQTVQMYKSTGKHM